VTRLHRPASETMSWQVRTTSPTSPLGSVSRAPRDRVGTIIGHGGSQDPGWLPLGLSAKRAAVGSGLLGGGTRQPLKERPTTRSTVSEWRHPCRHPEDGGTPDPGRIFPRSLGCVRTKGFRNAAVSNGFLSFRMAATGAPSPTAAASLVRVLWASVNSPRGRL